MNKKGQSTVEFALIAILLFTLLFAIIDLAMLFYVNLTMQHAVREGARYAITGKSDLGADRRSALIQKIKNCSNGLYDSNMHVPKDPTVSAVDNPNQITYVNYSGNRVTGNPGKANQIIIVSLTYDWPLLTPALKPFFKGGKYSFTVRATMRNEPFPSASGGT